MTIRSKMGRPKLDILDSSAYTSIILCFILKSYELQLELAKHGDDALKDWKKYSMYDKEIRSELVKMGKAITQPALHQFMKKLCKEQYVFQVPSETERKRKYYMLELNFLYQKLTESIETKRKKLHDDYCISIQKRISVETDDKEKFYLRIMEDIGKYKEIKWNNITFRGLFLASLVEAKQYSEFNEASLRELAWVVVNGLSYQIYDDLGKEPLIDSHVKHMAKHMIYLSRYTDNQNKLYKVKDAEDFFGILEMLSNTLLIETKAPYFTPLLNTLKKEKYPRISEKEFREMGSKEDVPDKDLIKFINQHFTKYTKYGKKK